MMTAWMELLHAYHDVETHVYNDYDTNVYCYYDTHNSTLTWTHTC